jgi:hypothetical protein
MPLPGFEPGLRPYSTAPRKMGHWKKSVSAQRRAERDNLDDQTLDSARGPRTKPLYDKGFFAQTAYNMRL